MDEHPIRFADVVIDPRRRELCRAGEPVAVQPRVFDLILYLAKHCDRAIGKDELQDAVWPGVIVTETALTRAVMKARRAVGDDSERQAVIRTVHAHGYRLVAELLPAPEGAPVAEPQAGSIGAGRRRGWRLLGGVALLALVAAGALFLAGQEARTPTRLAVLPIDERTGDTELAWASLGLMSYANRLLAEATGGETVGSRRMMDAFETLPREATDHQLQAVRRSLGASHLVQAVLERREAQLELRYRVFHERGAGPPAVLGGNDATRLARQMADAVIVTLPGGGKRRPFRSVSDDDFVNEAYARGLSLMLNGDAGRARDYFEVAVRQEPGLFWPRYELALTMRDTGELDEARALLDSLIAEPRMQEDSEMRAAAWNALAQIHWRQQDYQAARSAYEEALGATRKAGREDHEAGVLVNLGILARVSGELEDARRFLVNALAIHDKLGDRDVGAVWQSLGQVELSAGQLMLAREYFVRAEEAFQAVGNRRGAAASQNALARVDHRLGRLGDAERHMLIALEAREGLQDFFGRVASHLSLAEIYLDLEEPGKAAAHADQAIALAEASAYRDGLEEALETRAWLALETGEMATALAAFDRLAGEFGASAGSPRRRLLAARKAAVEGGVDEAIVLLEKLAADATANAVIDALRLLGSISGNRASALSYWDRALALAEQEHERGRLARVLVSRAERALADDDPASAMPDIERLSVEFPDWPALARLQAGVSGRHDRATPLSR